ncbi:MAG: ABC-2 transporter permease [Oscillospiraceae bacterium]|nr:ABC-2 transporter permease [Oscillospiraceae bacterium]
MKGLLLKDWYMVQKYCKSYLFITVIFIAVSLVSDGNMFFVFYPCLLCGMISVNLLAYDERSGWMEYSGTLPYTRTQIVSGKYLIGLFFQLAILIVTATVHGIKMAVSGNFVLGDFAVLMLLMMIVSTLTSSICLPFVFKLGVEKGRMAYYVMVGFVCAASAVASSIFRGQLAAEIQPNSVLAVLAAVGVGVYILSWYLSVVFFKAREMK